MNSYISEVSPLASFLGSWVLSTMTFVDILTENGMAPYHTGSWRHSQFITCDRPCKPKLHFVGSNASKWRPMRFVDVSPQNLIICVVAEDISVTNKNNYGRKREDPALPSSLSKKPTRERQNKNNNLLLSLQSIRNQKSKPWQTVIKCKLMGTKARGNTARNTRRFVNRCVSYRCALLAALAMLFLCYENVTKRMVAFQLFSLLMIYHAFTRLCLGN